jgi:hypothetical protein
VCDLLACSSALTSDALWPGIVASLFSLCLPACPAVAVYNMFLKIGRSDSRKNNSADAVISDDGY